MEEVKTNAPSPAQQDFPAETGNEIRARLNSLTELADLAISSGSAEKQRECLECIKSSTRFLRAMLYDTISLPKIEAEPGIRCEEFNLRDILTDLFNKFCTETDKKGIEFTISIAGNVPLAMYGDPGRLRRVVDRLALNAIVSTEKGKITVSAKLFQREERSVVIEFVVADTGAGISKERAKTIFDHGQNGNGLAVCGQIVKNMGGDIRMESSPGYGSSVVFKVRFDLEKKFGEGNAKNRTPVRSQRRARILIAEDEFNCRLVVKEILENAGAVADAVENGKDAVSMIMRNQYDAVLLDLNMAEMDGYEATSNIRDKLGLRNVPIIGITADAGKREFEKCLEAGMNDCVAKPLDTEKICTMLAKWLPGRTVLPDLDRREQKAHDMPIFLDGIDIKVAMKRMSGNKKLFFYLIRRFVEKYEGMAENIRELMEKGETRTVRNMLHTFLGATGNIGAEILYSTADKLMADIKKGDWKNSIRLFETELARVVNSIKLFKNTDVISTSTEKKSLRADPVSIKSALNELDELLRENNIKAEDRMDSIIRLLEGTPLRKKTEKLNNEIHRLDYSTARKSLAAIIESVVEQEQ